MKGKIFNAQEVQAIIAGNKTMFREVVKPQPKAHPIRNLDGEWYEIIELGKESKRLKCPYQVGQKIFCKESFWQFGGYDGGSDGDEARFIGSNKITFCPEEADKTQTLCKAWKKRPAQQMKQEHSRITLEITDIRVEKLREIKPIDCVHEGVWKAKDVELGRSGEALDAFAKNWNATHKKPEEKFEANPWVWCISFKIINN